VGQIGGPATAVTTAGDFAYVAIGARLEILDVAHWPDWRVVGATGALANRLDDLAARGGLLYAATDGGALVVIDVRDPALPRRVGGLGEVGPPSPNARASLALAERHAYVASTYGVRVVDIADPAHPREVSRVPFYAEDVAAAGTHLWAAGGEAGVRMFDMADPAAPREVAAFPGWEAFQIALEGDFAFVAAVELEPSGFFDGPSSVVYATGLLVIDARDPGAPAEVAFLGIPGAPLGLAVDGPRAFVVSIDRSWPQGRAMAVVDVARPEAPRWMATHAFGMRPVRGRSVPLHAAGSRVFLPAERRGLEMIDVGSPGDSAVVGQRAPLAWSPSYATVDSQAIRAGGRFAWVAGGTSGLRGFDMADPARPREVTTLRPGWRAVGLELAGDHAVVMAGAAGLRVVDLRDPERPAEVGRLTPSWQAVALRTAGRFAYAAAGGYGLRVVDIADRARPREVGAADGDAWDVAVAGRYAYVAAGIDGLSIYDVADPVRPRRVARLALPDEVEIVTVDITAGYVVAGGGNVNCRTACGIWTVDVADPANPRVAGTSLGETYLDMPRDVQATGTSLVVATLGGVLKVLDAHDPKSLVVQGMFALSEGDLAFTATPDRIYLVSDDWNDGEVENEGRDAAVCALDIQARGDPVLRGCHVEPPYGAYDVAVADGFAYLAGAGLEVVDARDPARPRLVGRVGGPDFEARRVAAKGGTAYLALEGGGIGVVGPGDLGDPARPGGDPARPGMTVWQPDWEVADLTVAGDLLFVATIDNGVRVVDIHDPAAPRELGAFAAGDPSWNFGAIEVAGDNAYVAFQRDVDDQSDIDAGLRIFGVHDPTAPADVGAVAYEVGGLRDTSLAIVDGHAYVTGENGAFVVDVRAPEAPGPAVALDLGHTWAVYADASQPHRLIGAGGLVYVFDTTVPAAPREIDALGTGGVYAAAVAGGLVYAAGGSGGWTIIDTRHPTGPHPRAHRATWGELGAVEVAGGYAYAVDVEGDGAFAGGTVSNAIGARVFDLEDPRAPVEVSTIGPRDVVDVAVAGDHAYLAHGDGLDVVDVSNPRRPRPVGTVAVEVDVVAVEGRRLYAFNPGATFAGTTVLGDMTILDVGDPATPRVLGAHKGALDVAAIGDGLVYLSGSGNHRFWIEILDARDPTNPQPRGKLALAERSGLTDPRLNAIAVDGTRAYGVDRAGSVHVVDVGDPDDPRLVARIDDPQMPNGGMTRSGGRLVAVGKGIVRVVAPRPAGPWADLGAYTAWWWPADVAVDERSGTIAVSTRDAGLWLLRSSHTVWLPAAWREHGVP